MNGETEAHPAVDFQHDKGPWISDLKPGHEFTGFHVARNPRLDPFRDVSEGKYMQYRGS
jgi:hypothetical protein